MTVPMVTAAYAALLGLLAAILTVRVIVNRVRLKVSTGDGGKAELAQAIRAHANFAEQAPFALLLIAFAEAGGAHRFVIYGLGAALVVARLASAWGLSHSLGVSPGRQAGAGLTILIVVATSLLILYRSFVA
jgi:uncharacterized protein